MISCSTAAVSCCCVAALQLPGEVAVTTIEMFRALPVSEQLATCLGVRRRKVWCSSTSSSDLEHQQQQQRQHHPRA
jgi:hypothetical protein